MSDPSSRLLVVAGSAADSNELLEMLIRRSERQPVELTLVVTTSSDAVGPSADRDAAAHAARRRLRAALARFRAAGLYVREASVGEGGPVHAVTEAVATGQVDEIVVATPPRRRLRPQSALGERLGAATGLPVTHVLGRPAGHRDAGSTQPKRRRRARGERHLRPGASRRRGGRARRADPQRPSAAWARSREPLPPLGPMAVLRLHMAQGLGLLGFVLLALAAAGATNG